MKVKQLINRWCFCLKSYVSLSYVFYGSGRFILFHIGFVICALLLFYIFGVSDNRSLSNAPIVVAYDVGFIIFQ